ncbi:MAG: hypothetical protein HY843_06575 [Bdellovibrio sp.]|nr:hypothetical protein [Bdellovibrio sp.]
MCLNKIFRNIVICLVLTFWISACTEKKEEPNSPQSRLKEYISKSFDTKTGEDRNVLMNYLTGQAKIRLSSWTHEQFRQAFIETKRKFIKLSFVEAKNLSPKEINITYELSYLDESKGKNAKIINKKSCQMIEEGGKWYISDVRNIKELIEYQNELTLP